MSKKGARRRNSFSHERRKALDRNTVTNANQNLGLYIHIPFCVKKCDYCDFLSAPATEKMQDSYVQALLTEIRSYKGKVSGYRVPTIFIGGGTPSAIDPSHILSIMEAIYETFSIDGNRLEATIEVNPGNVTQEKLETYKKAGINRLSFGLQSVDNRELKILGRIHTYEQFVDNYTLARKVGFSNINIDLMSALPGQTVQSWENTLNTVISLKPEHISAYSLIIEEGTPFYEKYGEGALYQKQLPTEDTDRLIYHRTKEILHESGYDRYEISNYAKNGYECKHNISYWNGTDYLGLGLGASSLYQDVRFRNIPDINQYINLCKQNEETKTLPLALRRDIRQLSLEDQMEEFMYLGLRLINGVDCNVFQQRFHRDIHEVYKDVIPDLISKQLLKKEGSCIALTDYGLDISNYVLSHFLLS